MGDGKVRVACMEGTRKVLILLGPVLVAFHVPFISTCTLLLGVDRVDRVE